MHTGEAFSEPQACSDKHCLALTSEGQVHSCGSISTGGVSHVVQS